ncbi:MAG: site-specific DNA-methyltransferase [Actinomycetota bacterium]|nr:site-specific DNA-methyltransferase [Actinomycetota bacterium]
MKARRSPPSGHAGRTATSNFGVSRRESHDATGFYQRFSPPELSGDDAVLPPGPVAQPFVCGDARSMDTIEDGSVALVVTSPPYFAGKAYEEELDREGVPSSYLEYLELLRDVFAECRRTLEPGGRIAVNVANLGRKPYRSLSADVIRILQDDLGLLLRGEVIWRKAEGATGSCAWGSFRSAANPVLRDLTERVIIASKGRFDRARSVKRRALEGLPHESTLMTDDFLTLTLDVWDIPAESARRVGHPAPFPVELPEQLIRLYTFRGDLVLDPFMGSGSALVAAARLGRRYVGYDLDPEYVATARRRVAEEGAGEAPIADRDARGATQLAEDVLTAAGFTVTGRAVRVPKTGVTVSFVATDADGASWLFDVAGPFTSHHGGMARLETVWRCLGRAHALRGRQQAGPTTPLVFLTTRLPARPGEGDTALRAAGPEAFFDAVDVLSADGRARLELYAKGGCTRHPHLGFWTVAELAPWRDSMANGTSPARPLHAEEPG